MSVNDLVLVQGMRDTRSDPGPVEPRPVAGAARLGGRLAGGRRRACLLAVWAVASNSPVDLTSMYVPGLDNEAALGDVAAILARNSLVLALHATACVAGLHRR